LTALLASTASDADVGSRNSPALPSYGSVELDLLAGKPLAAERPGGRFFAAEGRRFGTCRRSLHSAGLSQNNPR
jgi:hypothetical protein